MHPIKSSLFLLALSGLLAFPLTAIAAAPSSQQGTAKTPSQLYLDHLFSLLANATVETEARQIENEIWKSWMAQPPQPVRELVTKAMQRRRWYDFEGARKILDQVVALAPNYAEGWNQRAFILFLQEKYDQSLSDIEHALALEPRHFGALAGQARILMRQGRFATGQKILKQAVKIHPFLRERSMIIEVDEPKI